MKVWVMVNNYSSRDTGKKKGWYVIEDSAIINTGKPFYLPEHMGSVTVSLCCAIRIIRLGKHIEKKFANRYFSKYAPALHFKLSDYESKLIAEGLPTDPAVNFDRSLFIGDYVSLATFEPLGLHINGKKVSEFDINNLISSPEDILENFSNINTVKMGDVMIPGLGDSIEINEGDIIGVQKGNTPEFQVRVK